MFRHKRVAPPLRFVTSTSHSRVNYDSNDHIIQSRCYRFRLPRILETPETPVLSCGHTVSAKHLLLVTITAEGAAWYSEAGIAVSHNTLQIKIFPMDAKDSPQTQHAHHRKMVPRITQILGLTRWFSIVTVFSSLVGALLMFIIGAANTVEAVLRYFEIDGQGALLNHFFTPTSPNAAPRPVQIFERP